MSDLAATRKKLETLVRISLSLSLSLSLSP